MKQLYICKGCGKEIISLNNVVEYWDDIYCKKCYSEIQNNSNIESDVFYVPKAVSPKAAKSKSNQAQIKKSESNKSILYEEIDSLKHRITYLNSIIGNDHVTKKRINDLEADNQKLRAMNEDLRNEIEFLKTHPTIAAGLRGERLVLERLGGKLTEYAAEHNITLENGMHIEVKFSKLTTPEITAPNTHRWTWSKVLGFRDKGKDYDYLILIGEKDKRYKEQYLGDAPYVFFLIPRDRVPEIIVRGDTVGSNTNLTTNFRTVRAAPSKVIIEHMVKPELVEAIFVSVKVGR